MTDKAGDVAATGGGRAVPNDEVLMRGTGSLGDTAGMDDGGLNSGDSLEEAAGAAPAPQVAPESAGASPSNADAPTGGLSGTSVPSTGTIGGSPTGTAASSMGDKGG